MNDATLTEKTKELENAGTFFRRQADMVRADSVVSEGVEKRCQPFVAAGWRVPPAEVVGTAEAEEREKYDSDTRKLQSWIDREWSELETECRTRIAAAEIVAPEPGLDGHSEQTMLLARLTTANQRAAAARN
jgi:hypothetical protein